MKIKDIVISHPDKLLYPQATISKAEVVTYYAKVADYLLPHIKNHSVTLRRYPEGVEQGGFYNKHAQDYFPDYLPRITVPKQNGQRDMQMITLCEVKSLVYLAGLDVIEFHLGLSPADKIKKPDEVIFDFDPSDDDFEKVRASALQLKKMLDEKDIISFIKTSGSRGVHVHVPIIPEHDFEQVKPVAQNIAACLHKKCPEITTLEQRKNKRGNKVFIDYLRNDYAMTAIAAYSLRATSHASIATPIDWDELTSKAIEPMSYHLKNIFRRLAHKANPWKQKNATHNDFDKLRAFQAGR